jgi:hypothetical protein
VAAAAAGATYAGDADPYKKVVDEDVAQDDTGISTGEPVGPGDGQDIGRDDHR